MAIETFFIFFSTDEFCIQTRYKDNVRLSHFLYIQEQARNLHLNIEIFDAR